MASVTLTELWVHDGADLSDYVRSDGFLSESVGRATPGDVRRFAKGRRRLIRRPGDETTVQSGFPYAPRAVVEWLESHTGSLVMIRDPRGRLVWGTYLTLDVAEREGGALPDATFAVESLTPPPVA